jgi:hypothetical protein
MQRIGSTLMTCIVVAFVLLVVPLAKAGVTCTGSLTCVGTQGSLEATATFSIVAGDLQVVLDNSSLSDVLVPADVLTAVFFNIAGNPTLTRVSAVLTSGSTVFFDADGQPAGGVVGGEWAYQSGLSPYTGTSNMRGISSSGFDLFGPGDLFPGAQLDPPDSPDGMNYGLLSAGDNTGTGNAQVIGGNPFIKHSVTFTLSGSSDFTSLPSISNVIFQYGTALAGTSNGEPCIGCLQEIPEPSTMFSIPLIGAALVWHVRRRLRRSEA